MSVTIYNDSGSGLGTKILDEDGNDICVKLWTESINIDMRANGINRAAIVLGLVKTELKCGDVRWITKNPVTGDMDEISSITFSDKSRIVFDDRGVTLYDNDGIVVVNTLSDSSTMKYKSAPIDPKEK